VGGVLGDERLQHLQRVLTAVLPLQVPPEALAVLAVDLPARFLGHAGDAGGVHSGDQVVLAEEGPPVMT